jgi:DNA-binding CsgD family transcriptional regulator
MGEDATWLTDSVNAGTRNRGSQEPMSRHGQNRPSLRVSEKAVAHWRQEEEALAQFEEAANRDPVWFAKGILKCVAIICQEHNDYVNYLLHRFGVQYRVRLIGPEFRFRTIRVVNPRRTPRTRGDRFLYETARHQIMKLEAIISVLLAAVEKAGATHESEDRALSETFLRCFRRTPVLYGVDMQRAEDPNLRRGATLALSAWSAVFISRGKAPRLKRALADEDTTLFEALPPAAFVSFADWDPNEPLRPGTGKTSLVSRVSAHISDWGHEATLRPERVVAEPPSETSAADEVTERALAEFALREGRRAVLSEREYQIVELILQNFTEAEIAEKLGIAVGTVKKTRSRVRYEKSAQLRRMTASRDLTQQTS